MALLDRERGLIVLRVVYDGPPEAGKTTSLRALSGSLGLELYSPAEQDGRTLFFDWMDYTGGRFEGYQIRCQIVGVPGQRELGGRRRHLLRVADVVVFVADSTRRRLAETLHRLGELPGLVGSHDTPPVGVISQANKRDLPDAVPADELRAEVRTVAGNVGVVESVAADGTGIRETFVFAVRLALDRVREQLRTQTIVVGSPEIENGAELLEEMRAADGDAPPALGNSIAAPLLRQVLAENHQSDQLAEFAPWRAEPMPARSDEGPLPPDPSAPSGAIWPPVEGRLILHQATSTRLHQLRNGGWAAGIGTGWRTFSTRDAVFADQEVGRQTLIRLARLHVASADVLSPNRCVVLASTGQQSWRLWQIVCAERSLRDYLDDLDRCSTEVAAARILEVAGWLADISARMQSAPCHLSCSLDTIGYGERGAMYIGLMPMERIAPPDVARLPEQLGSELESVVYEAISGRRTDVLAAIARVPRSRAEHGGGRIVEDLLSHLMSG